MDTMIIGMYCVCDDLLRSQGHQEDRQRRLSDAEVMTIALVASYYYGGNYSLARWMLTEQKYIGTPLSKGCYSKRLHRVRNYFLTLFSHLASCATAHQTAATYILDSFPIAVCDNIRIRRCRLYHGESYRGYIASKKRFFYGLRVHLLITATGQPVEFFLVPGASNDAGCLDLYDFDLPTPARIVADKAFTDYELEDVLAEADLHLAPLRKSNSKRPIPPWETFLRLSERRYIESVGSLFNAFLPKHIHATSQLGFELKLVLFVLALAFHQITP
jgi:hypothetical protein